MSHFAKIAFTLFAAVHLFAQTKDIPHDLAKGATEITFCELSRDPAAFNHKPVKVIGFVTRGFENFQLVDPTCQTQGFSIWIMYGGKMQSGTTYCCPGEAGNKTRKGPLTVEGIQVHLAEDTTFQQFTKLLDKEPDTTVRLTMEGVFFSGEKQTINGSTHWGGAGHLGCCSLFVIQRVVSFQPHTRGDLDYTSEAGFYENGGCKESGDHFQKYVSIQFPDEKIQQVIAEQKRADEGNRAWAFDDPQRVAFESLKSYYPGTVPVLRRTKKASARNVFIWQNGKTRIVVVVAKPYWLSFYAASQSVVWVSTTVKEVSCD